MLDLSSLLSQHSLFLFGPRGTGKSFWIRETLSELLIINLLKTSDFLRLTENPSLLEEMVSLQDQTRIVIDEVQKIPQLLDEYTLFESVAE